jgi:hypothetical protein
VIGVGAAIGFVRPVANLLRMEPPVAIYAAILVGLLLGYMLAAQFVKMIYIKIFKS